MLSVYILLDRSGSMQSRWKTSIDSVNEYVNVLKESNIEGKINFIAFDLNSNIYVRTIQWPTTTPHGIEPIFSTENSVIEVVRKNTDIKTWAPLTGYEVTPRGSTPLFDAVLETKKLIESDTSDKGILIIMTDGAENASSNSKASAANAVKYVEGRGWEVVFLGANFDVTADATSMTLDSAKFATFSDANAVRTMNLTAMKSAAYATTGVSMAYTSADKSLMKDDS